MCPFCRQNAPLLYRGVVPYCTACGHIRAPLTERSVNHAGKPARVGGTVAHVAGYLVLGIGTALALGLGALAWALFTVTAALVVFLPIEMVALTIGLLGIKGGRRLQESGESEQKGARLRAVMGLAQTRGGILTALELAQATDMPPHEADAFLTDLAKTQPDTCSLEVDDQGQIYFRFANAPWNIGTGMNGPKVGDHVRVGVPASAVPATAAPAPVAAGPRVIDAELIEDDENDAAQRARRGREVR